MSSLVNNEIWIVAGEPSGDRYGAWLARALLEREPGLRLRGMGSTEMAAAGVDLLVDASDLAVVGFVEVVKHLRTFRRVFGELVAEAEKAGPAALVLIDYPGLNLRLAERLHALSIPVVYYVCPQVWAWGQRRIPKMAKVVDRLLTIFPFEPALFDGTGLDARFVGHPLGEVLDTFREPALERSEDTVLLLPGSRGGEICALLPVFLRAGLVLEQRRPALRCVVAAPSAAIAALCREQIDGARERGGAPTRVTVEIGGTAHWMQRASAGLAASGTVTLEAAILGLPLVTAYRLNPLTYHWARLLVKLPYFTIVNLVANRLVFEEFLQRQVRPHRLAGALERILPGGAARETVIADMADTVAQLGAEPGVAARVAESVLDVAHGNT